MRYLIPFLIASSMLAQTVDQSQRTGTNSSVVPRTFFGTSAPGSVTGNLPGDYFLDTTGHNLYVCGATSGTAAPACTSVTTGGWTLTSGASTAISVQSGNLGNFTGGAATRALGTIYQNTNSYPIYVVALCQSTGSGGVAIEAKTDSNSSPAQIVDYNTLIATAAAQGVGVKFWVLPNNYYQVINAAACGGAGSNGTIWTEWH